MQHSILPALAAILLLAIPGRSQDQATDPAAEKLWQEVVEAGKPPTPPADWSSPPTEEQQEAFKKLLAVKAGEAADKAREFYTKYPEHPKAAEAQEREKNMLTRAVALGDSTRLKQLESNPALTEEEKLQARMNQVQRRAFDKQGEGIEAVLAEFEKGARELLKDYPERGEPWQLLMLVASNATEEEKSRAIYKEIAASESAPEEFKSHARDSLKLLDAVGRPLELSFTAIDGREVDLQKMKGKVVLVDFWATWCGPCIKELPNVKRVYEELHDEGFEIVGISFDQSKSKLETFVKENEMPWPQYFDGKGWQNEIGGRFNITAIPAMWLVDKEGKLRDLSARENLGEKVKALLAEK